MSSAFSLLLVTIAASILMLLVLSSLFRSNVKGIGAWFAANCAALAGFVLFAGRNVLPATLSYEGANFLYNVAVSLMLAGFCLHLSRPVPARSLVVGNIVVVVVLSLLHYYVDVGWARVMVASGAHAVVCLAMAATVWRATAQAPARYPYRFTSIAIFVLAALHLLRVVVTALHLPDSGALFAATPWNLAFFALGVLAMPVLSLGALMMANARLVAQAVHAAEHDYLTGAVSRRAFFKLAEREHARVGRSGGDLSVLVFDIDHFKRINDTFGHASGDEVLVDIVRRTAGVIRQVDVCARLGGEEFALLLPDTSAAMASTVAHRLRQALERPLKLAATEVGYTVSIGIARLEPGESIGELLVRADRALYAAKDAGRNAAMCAQPGGANQALTT